MGLGHGIDSHSDSAHTSFAIVLHRHQKALLFRPLLALYGCVFWRGITADAEKNPEGHGPHRRTQIGECGFLFGHASTQC